MTPSAPQRSSNEPTAHAPAVPRGTETVLVVEDDDTVRTLLGRTLQALGYSAHLAASGAEALALHDAHGAAIDLILCDVVMPDISGPATVRRILDRPGTPPAIVFMSGHTDHALLKDGRLQGAQNFLQKPLARAAVARMLRDVLDAKETDRA